MGSQTNIVMYTPGYAPIGEMRDIRNQSDIHQLPSLRYARKRNMSNKAKMILMRKCKRYQYKDFVIYV